ncbi:MAG: VanW family protein [Acidimicrobiia bacterium]|nr:MAG: VanW family protein [Acidimicrobiia bacterium]
MRRYIIATAVTIPLLAVAFVATGYASDEMIGAERVSRGVTAAEMNLSRLTYSDATGLLASYEASLVSRPLTVVVEGNELTLNPEDVGFEIDEEAVATDAMTTRRSTGFFSNLRLWAGTFTSTIEVDVPTTIDEQAIAGILDNWTRSVLDTPAFEGTVRISNGTVVPEYPQAGLRIDVEASIPLLREQLSRIDRVPIVLPLVPLDPEITNADVNAAVAKASRLIDSAVILAAPNQPGTIVFTPTGLANALRSEIVNHSPAVLQITLDDDTLREIAARSAESFTVPPIDATFTFDEETRELSVVPSVIGQKVDLARIPEIVSAAAEGSGQGTIPMTDGEQAVFTTEMAEAMGPLGEVSSFTTNHPCCRSRVTNIQLLADAVGGSIVMPGETFSINDTAGERTSAGGYVRAGAIINGRIQCCDSKINIGGGTSQFATTFYNAVFFGCYEDVLHQPHSLYFSRYPFVREATLGFPLPDVIFRNDSDAIVYIDTTYTPTSITVTFFGNNGGRTCTAERVGNTVTRVMAHPDGSVTTQQWTWNYKKPKPDPDTTTTTHAPEPTTSTSSSTSTSTTSTSTTSTSTTTTSTSTTTSTTTTTTSP